MITAARSRRRPVAVALVLVSVVLGAAACTSSGTAINSPFSGTSPALEHGPYDQVKVQTISGLGPVLVNGKGLTLYLYETDQQGSPSRCYGICAIQWPPFLLSAGTAKPIAGPGIEPGLLGTSPRTNGTTQITYNGWPLYFWPPDRAPGKATGQALSNAGGRWYVVNPDGNAVVTP